MHHVRIFEGMTRRVDGSYREMEERISEWLNGDREHIEVVDQQMSTVVKGGDIFCIIAIFYRLKEDDADPMDPVQQVISSGGDPH